MKYLASSLVCLGLFTSVLMAAPIEFVGVESDIPDDGSFPVSNWSNPNVVKNHDLNGDDRFGGAGYYQIIPAIPAEIGENTTVLNAPSGNDLGVSLNLTGAAPGTLRTASFPSPPAFLSGIPVGGVGEFINTPDFPLYSDASGNSQLRQGSIWLSTSQNQGAMPGDETGYWNTAFSFTLNKTAGFRLGVAVDAMSFDGAAPDFVSISKVGGGDFFSDLLNRDGVSDMVFFDINGSAGEEFVVKLWQFNSGRSAFALVTFDQAPTPTLSYAQDGDNFILTWEQNIPGWILESSTDFGAADSWDPVPGVENNSVSVPMTGVPKNFFRLRKNP